MKGSKFIEVDAEEDDSGHVSIDRDRVFLERENTEADSYLDMGEMETRPAPLTGKTQVIESDGEEEEDDGASLAEFIVDDEQDTPGTESNQNDQEEEEEEQRGRGTYAQCNREMDLKIEKRLREMEEDDEDDYADGDARDSKRRILKLSTESPAFGTRPLMPAPPPLIRKPRFFISKVRDSLRLEIFRYIHDHLIHPSRMKYNKTTGNLKLGNGSEYDSLFTFPSKEDQSSHLFKITPDFGSIGCLTLDMVTEYKTCFEYFMKGAKIPSRTWIVCSSYIGLPADTSFIDWILRELPGSGVLCILKSFKGDMIRILIYNPDK